MSDVTVAQEAHRPGGRKMRILTKVLFIIILLIPFISDIFLGEAFLWITLSGAVLTLALYLILVLRASSRDVRLAALLLLSCAVWTFALRTAYYFLVRSHAGSDGLEYANHDAYNVLSAFSPLFSVVQIYALSLIARSRSNSVEGSRMADILAILAAFDIYLGLRHFLIGKDFIVFFTNSLELTGLTAIIPVVIHAIAWLKLLNAPAFFEAYDDSPLPEGWWNPLNRHFLAGIIALAMLCILSLVLFKLIAPLF